MHIIERLASKLSPEERKYHDWQFDLARRISQILEERNMTQREFARQTRLTEAQVSALLHCGANPTLSMLARISALLESELLTWINNDLESQRSVHSLNDETIQTKVLVKAASGYYQE